MTCSAPPSFIIKEFQVDNTQIYEDDICQRASENYNPYDYIYELEDDDDIQEYDLESFVWSLEE